MLLYPGEALFLTPSPSSLHSSFLLWSFPVPLCPLPFSLVDYSLLPVVRKTQFSEENGREKRRDRHYKRKGSKEILCLLNSYPTLPSLSLMVLKQHPSRHTQPWPLISSFLICHFTTKPTGSPASPLRQWVLNPTLVNTPAPATAYIS